MKEVVIVLLVLNLTFVSFVSADNITSNETLEEVNETIELNNTLLNESDINETIEEHNETIDLELNESLNLTIPEDINETLEEVNESLNETNETVLMQVLNFILLDLSQGNFFTLDIFETLLNAAVGQGSFYSANSFVDLPVTPNSVGQGSLYSANIGGYGFLYAPLAVEILNVTINSPLLQENVSKLQALLNVSISEMGNVWYNLNSQGNISLCFSCNNKTILLNFTNYGNQTLIVYANDSSGNLNVSSFDFVLNLDSDLDGLIDSIDTDDDNDGISDDNDGLSGNLSNLNTGISGLSLVINGSSNLSQQFSDLLVVNFSDANGSVLEFSYNFSHNQTLVLANVTIDRQNGSSDVGSVLVRGINLTAGQTKTVYVDDLHSEKNSVCVEDRQIVSIGEVSSDCSGSEEILVSCSGSNGGYTCTDLGSIYKVEGLEHSGVVEISDAVVVDNSEGSSGGGSWGGSAIQVNETIEENVIENPEQLFGIRLKLENTIIENINELIALVNFENFGAFPTLVNLTFIIWNEYGGKVYEEKDEITVATKKILRWDFEGLDELPNGKYVAVLEVLYNVNVSNEFKQEFEIRKERNVITGLVVDFVKGDDKWWLGGVIGLIIISGLTWIGIKKVKMKYKNRFNKKVKVMKHKMPKNRIIIIRKKKHKVKRKGIKRLLGKSHPNLRDEIARIKGGK